MLEGSVADNVATSTRRSGASLTPQALGATPQRALAPHTRAALGAAMIPTINGLLTVGLVALPGMMTGHIGGGAPEQAIRYQVVIMSQLVVTAATSGALAARRAPSPLHQGRADDRPGEDESAPSK